MILAVAVIIVVLGLAVLVLGGTDFGVWALGRYARSRGGEWRQAAFLCPGCPSGAQRHHIARPGPLGTTLCVNCSPAPAREGTR